TYTPSPVFSLSVQTEYLANQRATLATGSEVPQRNGRTLNFTGGGNLNFPLGSHARFTGDIRRTYRADRTITYQLGLPQPAPLSEYDFWNGRLELTWDM